jgi:hypothetical protein
MKVSIRKREFSELTPLIVYILFSSLLVLFFQRKGLGNDFPTFYEAGKSIHSLSSPWAVNAENEYTAYLNGPATSLVFGLFAFFPYQIALLLVRVLSLSLIPLAFKSICRMFGLEVSSKRIYLVSSITLFTFPVRANLEYGQFAIIFSSVFIIALNSARVHSKLPNQFLLGLISATVLDYKPQLFLPVILIFCLGYLNVIYGFIVGCTFSIVTSWVLSGNLMSSWSNAVLGRSQQSANGGDQMSPYALLNLSRTAIYEIAVILTIVFLANHILGIRKYDQSKRFAFVLISFTVWSAITPFSHPTDMYISILVGFSILFTSSNPKTSLVFLILLSFTLTWSNNLLITALSTLVIFILIMNTHSDKNLMRPFNIIVFLMALNLLPLISRFVPSWEGHTRQIMNLASVISVAILTTRVLSQKKLSL